MICRTEVETGDKRHVRTLAAQKGVSLDTLSSQILQLRLPVSPRQRNPAAEKILNFEELQSFISPRKSTTRS